MMDWLEPTVRASALFQSLPTPRTQELFRVLISETVGAPLLALAEAVAPTAPEPFVPVVSTPLKLSTVMELAAELERVAVTTAFAKGLVANARQISAVPCCALVRFTNDQVSPAPDILFTCMVLPDGPSVATKASRSSLPAEVVKAGVDAVLDALERSAQVCASTISDAVEPPPWEAMVKFAMADVCRRESVTD